MTADRKLLDFGWMKAVAQDCCKMIGDLKGTESETGIAVHLGNEALRDKLNAAIDALDKAS